MKIKKLTFSAVLLAFALVIFIAEAQLPPLAPIPGIKLGLANIITVSALYMLGRREAFVILMLRIILGGIFTGNAVGFVYSISGGLVSFAVVAVVSVFVEESGLWAVSVLGAIGHNVGQILAAVVITGTVQILWYLPVLIISAVITGTFTGVAAQITLRRLRKTKLPEDIKNA